MEKTTKTGLFAATGVLVLCCGGVALLAGPDDDDRAPRVVPVVTTAETPQRLGEVTVTTVQPRTTPPRARPTTTRPRQAAPRKPTRTPTRAATRTRPPAAVYYANCAEARAAGVTPLLRGEPGYRAGLDRDRDGDACE